VTETNQNELKKISHPIKSGSLVHLTVFEDFDFIFVREASYEISEKLSLLNKQLWKLGRSGMLVEMLDYSTGHENVRMTAVRRVLIFLKTSGL